MALTYTVKGSVTIEVAWETQGDLETLKKSLARIRDIYESSGGEQELEPLAKLADEIEKKLK